MFSGEEVPLSATHAVRRACIRVDGSYAIGSGHIMRCVNLATSLRERGMEITFISRLMSGHYCDWLEEQGFVVHRLIEPPSTNCEEGLVVPMSQEIADSESLLSHLGSFDWIIVDHYGLDSRWQSAMRPFAGKILVIDDLADRMHDCDLLVDQNYFEEGSLRYANKVPLSCITVLGPKFALLQSEYKALHSSAMSHSGEIRRILVSFGGHGYPDLVMQVMEAFSSLSLSNVQLAVVLDRRSPKYDVVQTYAANHNSILLHDRQSSLAPLMAQSDLAIGASGSTSWERLCMGLPSLVVSLAENQRPIASELDKLGVVCWMGHHDEVSVAKIREALKVAMDRNDLAEWSRRGWELVDGQGVSRVVDIMLCNAGDPISLRPATPQDKDILFEWVNESVVRHYAFSSAPIDLATHTAWFSHRLDNPSRCRIYIAESANRMPLGQVRFDLDEIGWRIDYSVSPLFRGKGFGKRILGESMTCLKRDIGPSVVYGQVKHQNFASHNVFGQLGFRKDRVSTDMVQYLMSMEET